MKKKKKKINPQYVKICPKCKSLDVESRLNVGIVFGMPQKYRCRKCGYSSYFFPEIDLRSKKEEN